MSVYSNGGLGSPYQTRAVTGVPPAADPKAGFLPRDGNPPGGTPALDAVLDGRFVLAGTTPWELPQSKPA